MEGLFPDEILWMDEHAETDAQHNLDRRDIKITFSDGSYLRLGARSKLPPLSEMTNELVEGFDPETGQFVLLWDDGTLEAAEITARSAAFRLLQKLVQVVRELPERPKRKCSRCQDGWCPYCHGKGCPECYGRGICPHCQGRGQVLRQHT